MDPSSSFMRSEIYIFVLERRSIYVFHWFFFITLCSLEIREVYVYLNSDQCYCDVLCLLLFTLNSTFIVNNTRHCQGSRSSYHMRMSKGIFNIHLINLFYIAYQRRIFTPTLILRYVI